MHDLMDYPTTVGQLKEDIPEFNFESFLKQTDISLWNPIVKWLEQKEIFITTVSYPKWTFWGIRKIRECHWLVKTKEIIYSASASSEDMALKSAILTAFDHLEGQNLNNW